MERPKTWGEYKRAIEAAGVTDDMPVTTVRVELHLADVGPDRFAEMLEILEQGKGQDGIACVCICV